MSRENVEAKARRYLTEGRVCVVTAEEGYLEAFCRGAGQFYAVFYHRGDGWQCVCPSRGRCAHIAALQLISAPRPKDIAHWLTRSREDVPDPRRGGPDDKVDS
jgi:uncharacterized Zn finger protein